MERAGITLYLGHYVSERIRKERGLPAFNAAGTNRMRRLGSALRVNGVPCVILAPGAAGRMAFGGRLAYPATLEHAERVPIVYCAAFAAPFLSFVSEWFFVLWQICALHRKRKIEVFIGYCYYPSTVLAALFAKLFLRAKIVFDVEDICRPSLNDWCPHSGARPVQQLVGFVLLKLACWLSQAVIVPSKRFIPFLSFSRHTLVVTGCMNVASESRKESDGKRLQVLFSGKIEDEHGIDVLMAAIQQLDQKGEASLAFDICGKGDRSGWVSEQCRSLRTLEARFHGFVSNERFNELLSAADVCVVLQNPHGRHACFKTPSKAYEAMGAGCAVIVTDVGDFAELPQEICLLCKPNTPDRLAEILSSLSPAKAREMGEAARQYACTHWSLDGVGTILSDVLRG